MMDAWHWAQAKRSERLVKSLRDQFMPRRIYNSAPVPIPSATIINPTFGYVLNVVTTSFGPPTAHTYRVVDLMTGYDSSEVNTYGISYPGGVLLADGLRLPNVKYNTFDIGQYVSMIYGVYGFLIIMTPELPQTGTC
jgi:hypothetical protein